MTTAANQKHQAVTFDIGNSVWLSSKNIHTNRPSKKLDDKMIRLFKVIEKHRSLCVLVLPNTINIYQTFYVSLLQKYLENPLPGQQMEPPPPVVIDGEQE